jgi:site-specific recombinase XerD
MKGTRPLDNNEIRLVSACFSGKYEVRNRSLFLLGVSTGGRISELLSLRIGDVYQNGKPVKDLLFDRSIVGGEVSRAVPVNTDGMRAIEDLIRWHREQYRTLPKSRPLFPSRNGNHGRKRMTRRTAHNVLKKAFIAAGLNGHLATHSLRKSFAQRLYEQTGDVFSAQEMLGHKSIATTQKYLGVNYANVRAALQKMSLDSELHDFGFLGSSIKNTPDETLFLELARRGYDLSKLRDEEATGEVVRIG